MVFTLRDGKIVSVRGYTDHAEALAAAGAEPPLHGS
jgi:ketosteroid isomerase-like protein